MAFFEDHTLPAPHISDESETFGLVTDAPGADEAQQYDGMVKETAFAFRRTEVTEVMYILDPDPEADMKFFTWSSCFG